MDFASKSPVPEGKLTEFIYNGIVDGQLADVAATLRYQLDCNPRSRAAQSLLAYCYWHMEQYESAAPLYESLAKAWPDHGEYLLYWAQCLYKGARDVAQYTDALKICQRNENAQLEPQFLQLQAAIKLELRDLDGSRLLVNQMVPDTASTLANQACLRYRDGDYDAAAALYKDAVERGGPQPAFLYGLALCWYQVKDYHTAREYLERIVREAEKAHPELLIGQRTSVANSPDTIVPNSTTLSESFVVEALNLAAAICYRLKEYEEAQQRLLDMPPRREEDLEPEVLHNGALVAMELAPSWAEFEKLHHLVSTTANPPEALSNLLLLYVRAQFYDMALDMLASNEQEAVARVSAYVRDLIKAVAAQETSQEASFAALETLRLKHVERMRQLDRQLRQAPPLGRDGKPDEAAMRRAIADREEATELFVPILMAQGRLLWRQREFAQLEKLLLRAGDFCGDTNAWQANVAHTLFRMENREGDALRAYEAVMAAQASVPLLKIQPMVLANMCVLLCILERNHEAENIMMQLEQEEELAAAEAADEHVYHLCTVNLVIGTLYCERYNYRFGIQRVMKAFEPFERRLGPATWGYAKRCLVALYEKLARHLVVLEDAAHRDILAFLSNVERHGKDVPASLDLFNDDPPPPPRDKVAYEARLLKSRWLDVWSPSF